MSIAVHVSCPRTFAEECRALALAVTYGSSPQPEYAYIALCQDLAYVAQAMRAPYGADPADYAVEHVELERIVRDRAGYCQGIYYGHDGLCLYRVDIADKRFTVRADSRQTLRSALRRLFPQATIGR